MICRTTGNADSADVKRPEVNADTGIDWLDGKIHEARVYECVQRVHHGARAR